MMKPYYKHRKVIEAVLKKRYEERGENNFYFKSKNLVAETGLSGIVIGRTIHQNMTDIVMPWNNHHTSSNVYKTIF